MAEKLPLWRNIRWVQLAYGGVIAYAGLRLFGHFTDGPRLTTGGLIGSWVLLAVSTLVFLIYLQNVHRFGLVPDYSLKCRFCNGPVNRYSEFCEHCGADLIAEELLVPCAKCGVDAVEGTKFCPECGARITSKKKGKRERPPAEDT